MSDYTFQDFIEAAMADIIVFAEMLGCNLWSGQVEFLRAVQEVADNPDLFPKRVVCRAGVGVGKSYCMAIIALWALMRTVDTKVVCTAPSEAQVRRVLFGEIHKLVANSPEAFRRLLKLGETQVSVVGHTKWSIFARTAGSVDAAQGLHAEGMFMLMDEMSGIPDPVLEAFLATASGPDNVSVAIGNPVRRSGSFYRAFTSESDLWPRQVVMSKVRLAEERPDLVDPRLIAAEIAAHGVDSDYIRVRYMAQWPRMGSESILPANLVEEAMDATRIVSGIRNAVHQVKVIGIDFARKGGDENAIMMRSGDSVIDWWAGYCTPKEALHRAYDMALQRNWRDPVYVLDAVGMGQAMADEAHADGKRVVEFGSHYTSDEAQYADMQTAAWFNLRDSLLLGNVALPDDPKLYEQLVTREFEHEATGRQRIKVESKKDYKKRSGLKSPDRADALIMTWAVREDRGSAAKLYFARGQA